MPASPYLDCRRGETFSSNYGMSSTPDAWDKCQRVKMPDCGRSRSSIYLLEKRARYNDHRSLTTYTFV